MYYSMYVANLKNFVIMYNISKVKSMHTVFKCIFIFLFIISAWSLDDGEQLQNFEDAVDRVREGLEDLKNSINIQSENLLKQRRSIEDLLSSFDSKEDTEKLDELLQSSKTKKRKDDLNSDDNFNKEEGLKNGVKMPLDSAELKESDDALVCKNNRASATNDETNMQKNDFSHEANYKLSKLEQDASEKRKDALDMQWNLKSDLTNKRDSQFNAMNEVKLKTSSRLMDRGFGPSLPSNALEDNQRDISIDEMLRKLEKNWVDGAGKQDNFDKTQDNTKDYDFNEGDLSFKPRVKRLYSKSKKKTHEELLQESEKFPLSSLSIDKNYLEDFIQSLKASDSNMNEKESSYNSDNEKEQNMNAQGTNLNSNLDNDSDSTRVTNANSDSLSKKSSEFSHEQKCEEKDGNSKLDNSADNINTAKESDTKLNSEASQNDVKRSIHRSNEEIKTPEKDIGEIHAAETDKLNAEVRFKDNRLIYDETVDENENDANAYDADYPEMEKSENYLTNDKSADLKQSENVDESYLDDELAYAELDNKITQKRSLNDKKSDTLNIVKNKAEQTANMFRSRREFSGTKQNVQPAMIVRTKRQAIVDSNYNQKKENVSKKSANKTQKQKISDESVIKRLKFFRNRKYLQKRNEENSVISKPAKQDPESKKLHKNNADSTFIEINNDIQLANMLNSNFKRADNYLSNNVYNDNLAESKTDMQQEMSAHLNPFTNEQLLIYVPTSNFVENNRNKNDNNYNSNKLGDIEHDTPYRHDKKNKENENDLGTFSSINCSSSQCSNTCSLSETPSISALTSVTSSAASSQKRNNEEKNDSAMKLNITINANLDEHQNKKLYGNSLGNIHSAFIEDPSRRGIFLSDVDNPFERDKFLHKPRSSCCGETDTPINNLLNGKLSSEVVKSVFSLVRSTPKFQVLWPALKHNNVKRSQHWQNFYAIRSCNSERKVQNDEGLMERAMECINDIVDQQARLHTCLPLRPDLAGFYELILETYQQQDHKRDNRQTKSETYNEISLKPHTDVDAQQIEEKSISIRNLLEQYEQLPIKQKYQASKLRDDLLRDLIYLRKLKELHDERERKRRDQVLKEHDQAQQQQTDDKYVKQYESLMSPEYLKLMKTAELLCETQN